MEHDGRKRGDRGREGKDVLRRRRCFGGIGEVQGEARWNGEARVRIARRNTRLARVRARGQRKRGQEGWFRRRRRIIGI